MVLNTEWTQLEIIELLNELPSQNFNDLSNIKGSSVGSGGFGFGITGNKSTGVVVKVITQGGSADKDGRLKINDQLFQIGSINVRGMNSEQVAAVLRQSAFQGQFVKFLVARPIQNSISDFEFSNSNEIININQEITNNEILNVNIQLEKDKHYLIKTIDIIDKKINFLDPISVINNNDKSKSESKHLDKINNETDSVQIQKDIVEKNDIDETFDQLDKDAKEMLQDNDYMIQFFRKCDFDDEKTLLEYINKELNDYGLLINIKGEKYYINKFFESMKKIFLLPEMYDQLLKINNIEIENIKKSDILEEKIICFNFSKNFFLKSEILTEKWHNYLTQEENKSFDYIDFNKNELEIIVGRIDKTNSKNLGISLEGTVDLDENGMEKFPHHYIRSILPNGPLDKSTDTKFTTGDELLEIDSTRLYSLNYVQVLEHLKNLKNKTLILVCARQIKKKSNNSSNQNKIINLDFEQKSLSECKNDLIDENQFKSCERTEKKTLPDGEKQKTSIEKINYFHRNPIKINHLCVRSRSLEFDGPKLWNKKISFITLTKEQAGLGFSLIDYQSDPFNPLSKTMIVIRALVPGSVAHLDGRLMPGQRLISINDHVLDDDLIFKTANNKMQSFLSIIEDKNIFTSKINNIFKTNLLSYAVSILKNLPVNKMVCLGIQNPLPYPDAEISSIQSQDEDLNTFNSTLATFNLEDGHNRSVSINDQETNISTTNLKQLCNNIIINEEKLYGLEYTNKNKSEGDIASLRKNQNGKKIKNKIKYGIAATSAPAILNQASGNFYSSSWELRKNTLNFYNQNLKPNENESDVQIKSYFDNLNSKSNCDKVSKDLKCFKSELEITNNLVTSNESEIQNQTKIDRSISVSFPLNANLLENEKINPKISSTLSGKISDSVKFLNKLLFNHFKNENKYNMTRSERHLIKEDQFHKAFINNINKKLQILFDNHRSKNTDFDLENLEIQLILDGRKSFFQNKYENEIEFTNEDTLINNKDEMRELRCNFESLEQSLIFDIFDKIIYKMALHTWPRIILKPKRENIFEINKKIHLKSLNFNNRKNHEKNKKTSFDKQICVINQSRSPSSTRFCRNISNNSYRFRSKSLGFFTKTANLEFKNNSLSKIYSKPSNKIKIINILGKEIVKLPSYLEKELRIIKNFYPLGISMVDCSIDEGINGCIIKKIETNSACAKDGRLKVGDYLLSVNNENMRILTNSSARAILNRASLTSKDVVIIYIPFEKAIKFKNSVTRFDEKTNFRFSSLPSASKSFKYSSSASSSYSTKSISLESSDSFQYEKTNNFEKSKVSAQKKEDKITAFDKYQLVVKNNHLQNEELHCEIGQDKIKSLEVSEFRNQSFDKMIQPGSTDHQELSGNLWGPHKIVILERKENQSLGISIVGGKLDVSAQKENDKQINFFNGIFVKHVQDKSPAGINGILKTGDRILAVNDTDLTKASHDHAVAVIKNSKSPVKFLIQSLIYTDSQEKLNDEKSTENVKGKDSNKNCSIFNQSNKYNYSLEAIKKKYNYFFEAKEISDQIVDEIEKNEMFIFHLKKKFPNESLGLSLSGNIDLNKKSVFVCDIHPNSVAQKHGLIKIGDQILEVNGHLIYGRAHSNASPLIKNITDLDVYLVILRNSENLKQMFKPANFMLDVMSDLTNKHSTIFSDQLTQFKEFHEPSFDSISCRSSLNKDNSEFLGSCFLKTNQLEQQNKKKIKLKKGFSGFGIIVSEDKTGQFIIKAINSSGIAFKDGRLKVGDIILAINNIQVNSIKYNDIMKLLQSSDQVEFEILNSIPNIHGETKDSEKNLKDIEISCDCLIDSSEKLTESSRFIQKINQDPKTNIIRVGEETWIEIDRKKMGLGLSIIGGCDTQLPGIVINDIYENGAAFNDERLLIGDQILKVDNTDLISVTHDQALNALRQTSDTVKFLIHRGFSHSEKILQTRIKNNLHNFGNNKHEKFMDIFTIELNKKFRKGLGFSIIGHRGGSGIFISHLIKGGCAHLDGRLTVGDLILEVNDEDIRKSAYDEVAFLLKTLPPGKVKLKIGRFKTSNNNNRKSSSQVIIDQKIFF